MKKVLLVASALGWVAFGVGMVWGAFAVFDSAWARLTAAGGFVAVYALMTWMVVED